MPEVLFIVFNLLDAYSTSIALKLGAVEINPLMASVGSNILIKGLMAMGVILILYLIKKEKLIWYMNFVMLGIVLWNLTVCAAWNAGVKL